MADVTGVAVCVVCVRYGDSGRAVYERGEGWMVQDDEGGMVRYVRGGRGGGTRIVDG